MKHWLLNCKEISHLVSQSMDTKLPLQKRLGIKFHLLICRYCDRYAKQLLIMRNTIHAFSDVNDGPPLKTMSGERKERLKEMMRHNEE
jgi:hypothetical protein